MSDEYICWRHQEQPVSISLSIGRRDVLRIGRLNVASGSSEAKQQIIVTIDEILPESNNDQD